MKFEHTETFNLEGAFRGLRNPMESWSRSDSDWEWGGIGPKDMDLALRMIRAGGSHAKFLRQILVSVDITAPLYFWRQMDQYKVGTVTDSESTMHRLAGTPITRERFAIPGGISRDAEKAWGDAIKALEALRAECAGTGRKADWLALVSLLPCGWLQKRTWTANYAVVRNICIQRRGHKLPEWGEFIEWAGTLPYGELMLMEGGAKRWKG